MSALQNEGPRLRDLLGVVCVTVGIMSSAHAPTALHRDVCSREVPLVVPRAGQKNEPHVNQMVVAFRRSRETLLYHLHIIVRRIEVVGAVASVEGRFAILKEVLWSRVASAHI